MSEPLIGNATILNRSFQVELRPMRLFQKGDDGQAAEVGALVDLEEREIVLANPGLPRLYLVIHAINAAVSAAEHIAAEECEAKDDGPKLSDCFKEAFSYGYSCGDQWVCPRCDKYYRSVGGLVEHFYKKHPKLLAHFGIRV
jgi:hypothetical protein